MKATAATLAVMAAGAMAQPHHGHHHHARHVEQLDKRATHTVTHWETQWVYHTVTVDANAIFMESSTSSSSSSTTESSESSSTTESTSHSTTTTTTATTEATSTSYHTPSTTSTSSTTTTTPTPTTTTQQETTTSTTEAAETTTAGSGSGSGFNPDHSGFITYYDIGLGACGFNDGGKAPSGTYDDPMIVAISRNVYFTGGNPNNNALCNQKIMMESPDNPGTYAYGIIRDACEACTTAGDIDVNIDGMRALYGGNTEAVGKGSIKWTIV